MLNLTTNELINKADFERNLLAMAIVDSMESDIVEAKDSKIEALEEVLDSVARDMANKLDEDMQSYIDDYYLKADGDYVGEYGYLIIESDALNAADLKRRFEEHMNSWNSAISGLCDEAEEKLLDFTLDQWEALTVAMATDIDACTDIDIRHTFSSGDWCDVYSFSFGEIEDEAVHWLEGFEPELREKIAGHSSVGYFKDEYVYFNLSDTFANWSIDLEWLEEYLTE